MLGNHTGNLKLVDRNQEAEALRADVLQKMPLILKPLPNTDNGIIRGVACAFRINGEFDEEAAALYVKDYRLKQKKMRRIRRTSQPYSSGLAVFAHPIQRGTYSSILHSFLGIEHATTKLVQLKSRLSSFVRDDIEVEGYVKAHHLFPLTRH